MAAVNHIIERGARVAAARYFSRLYNSPEENRAVQIEVEARWREFVGDAQAVFATAKDPGDSLFGGIKAAKEREDAERLWNDTIDVIIA